MIRLLAPMPAAYNRDQLLAEAQAVFPTARGINQVDDNGPMFALYLPDDTVADEPQWAAVVAAHVPVFESDPVDPIAVFDAAAAGTLSLAKLKAAYRASLVALLDSAT